MEAAGKIQQELLRTLLEGGDEALHAAIQHVWPLDARAAFGALPTPLRLHADPRFTGRGVTVAFVDSGFHPHPDLVTPLNRIRAWADATREEVRAIRLDPRSRPSWPGADDGAEHQWHGTMTSASACGNGALSDGLYRGLASDASVVLVQVRDASGRIRSASVARALRWLRAEADVFGLGVVSLSCSGDATDALSDDPVDAAVKDLVDDGIVVVAAAGNDGTRRLVPPASSPWALTVGGIDDRNTFDHDEIALWHSNYGATFLGATKPDLVAPSLWIVAPVLPGTDAASEARDLFARRYPGGAGTARPEIAREIEARRLVTEHYQHVEGTSFAAPLVASAVACLLEANPKLTPALVRHVLVGTAHAVPGAPPERQGAGALDAGRAVAHALAERHASELARGAGPYREEGGWHLRLHDHAARRVEAWGSWDGWRAAVPVREVEPGLWCAPLPGAARGRVAYKFLLDGRRWLDDPGNPRKTPDGRGGLNSVWDLGS